MDPHRLRVVHEKKARRVTAPNRGAQEFEDSSQADDGKRAEVVAEQKTSDGENSDSGVEKNGTQLTSEAQEVADGLSQSSEIPSNNNDVAQSPDETFDPEHTKTSDDNENGAPHRAIQEIMFDLQRRVRQECAHPGMHFERT